jgi:hypothetical protein
MTAEKIIDLLNKNGIQLKRYENDIGVYGNISANISIDHPIMRMFKLHLDVLCKHFNV